MKKAIVKIVILMFTIWLVSRYTHLIHVSGWLPALMGALLLAVLNALVRPLLVVLTLPVSCLTLGLFIFFLNGLILMIVGWIVPEFATYGWWKSTLASVLISTISIILNWVLDVNRNE